MEPGARHAVFSIPSALGASIFVQAALNFGGIYYVAFVPVFALALFGYLALYRWLVPAEPANWRALIVPGISIVLFQVAFWILLFVTINRWR